MTREVSLTQQNQPQVKLQALLYRQYLLVEHYCSASHGICFGSASFESSHQKCNV